MIEMWWQSLKDEMFLGYTSDGEWVGYQQDTICDHRWEEKLQFQVDTYFECSRCGSTKTFNEMSSRDIITKRITSHQLKF